MPFHAEFDRPPVQCIRESDADPGKVMFILDVANHFEQELLQQWIAAHHTDTPAPASVVLSLSSDQSGLDSRALVDKLQVDSNTVLAPLRVAWLPSQAALDSGPRLRDFLFGDPRRPNPKRARRIVQDSPEQVHCIAAAPGSIAELQEAFAQLQLVQIKEASSVVDVGRHVVVGGGVVGCVVVLLVVGGGGVVVFLCCCDANAVTSNSVVFLCFARGGGMKRRWRKIEKGGR